MDAYADLTLMAAHAYNIDNPSWLRIPSDDYREGVFENLGAYPQ